MSPTTAPHIALVVSPLRSLMIDQLQSVAAQNISAAMINRSSEMSSAELRGCCQVDLHVTV